MLCAVGYILRMPRSPMILYACIVLQGDDPYLGIVLNIKGTLFDFIWKKRVYCRLAKDVSLCAGHVLSWVVT